MIAHAVTRADDKTHVIQQFKPVSVSKYKGFSRWISLQHKWYMAHRLLASYQCTMHLG